MKAFEQLESWAPANKVAAVIRHGDIAISGAQTNRIYRLASVTKPLFAYAVLVSLEEGTLGLQQVVHNRDITVAHLLSHSSGLAPERPEPGQRAEVAAVGSRRVYSNYGFEILGQALEQSAGMSAEDYLNEAVIEPLQMSDTGLVGSPAHGAHSTIGDLSLFAAELLRPTLISEETLKEATTPYLGDISGVLPGYGRQDPNPWGLGFEIRGSKSPHWTSTSNSAATFGHFGRSGTFLWIDPAVGAACVVLTDEDFGPWAAKAWPSFSDAVLEEVGLR